MDYIRFSFVEAGAVAVQCRHDSDPFTKEVNYAVSLSNPQARAQTMEVVIAERRNRMPEVTHTEMVSVPPGETRTVTFDDLDRVSERFSLFTLVRDTAGNTHYSRFYAWKQPREHRWESIRRKNLLSTSALPISPMRTVCACNRRSAICRRRRG